MTRWLRRLLRAKLSLDLTIVTLVLCSSVFIFRHLNQRTAVHTRRARVQQQNAHIGDENNEDGDGGGPLLEINLNEQQQQLQKAQLPTQVEILSQRPQSRDVDQRILHIGDFRSADCRSVRIC